MRKESVPIPLAARILDMSQLSVQCSLKENALPIGGAWKNEGSTCYKYHISPYLLGRYVGMKKSEVYQLIDEYKKEKENNKAC